MRSVARPRGPREPRRTQKTRGTREMPGTPQKAGWRRRSEPRQLLPGGAPGLSDPASCAASLGASASHSSDPDISTGLPVKRDRCHHFTFFPQSIWVVSRDGFDLLAAVLAYHPFDTVVRRYAIL